MYVDQETFNVKNNNNIMLFDYCPGKKIVFCREFLCDCISCLNFNFDQCLKENDIVLDINDKEEGNDSYFLEYEEKDEGMKVCNFVEIPSYSALIPYHKIEPIYIIHITEKGIASNLMKGSIADKQLKKLIKYLSN